MTLAPTRSYARLQRRLAPVLRDRSFEELDTDDQKDRCEEAIADLMLSSPAHLANSLCILECQMASDSFLTDDDRIVMRAVIRPHLTAARYVTRYRQQLDQSGRVPTPKSQASQDLDRVLDAIRQSVSIIDILSTERPDIRIFKGRREAHGGCPSCGGKDRFVIHDDAPPSWGWCRQCQWAPDALGLAAFLWGKDLERIDDLRETATRLAREYGVAGIGVAS